MTRSMSDLAGARDSSDVPVANELRDEELVRLFAHARDRGDRDRAVQVWEQIVINNADRVTAWVAAWRYPGSGDRVQDVDRDEAASRAFWKVGRKEDGRRVRGRHVPRAARGEKASGRLPLPRHIAPRGCLRQAPRRIAR